MSLCTETGAESESVAKKHKENEWVGFGLNLLGNWIADPIRFHRFVIACVEVDVDNDDLEKIMYLYTYRYSIPFSLSTST